MNFIKIKNYILLIASVLVVSCNKDTESFKPYQDAGQVFNLIEKINDLTESYTFNAQDDQVFATRNNVIIEYTGGTLNTLAGEKVDGSVKLVFNEVISAGQSILLGGSTKVSDKIFSSVSLLNVGFEDVSGNSLKLSENTQITIYYPVNKEAIRMNTRMFRGVSNNNSLNWSEISDPMKNNDLEERDWEKETNIGLIFGHGYRYTASELGWYALGDYFENDGVEKQEICVKMPKLFNDDNTKVFFVFEDLISIVDLHTFRREENLFCGELSNTMDSNSNYIITLSNTEAGDYYLGYYNNPNSTSTLLIEPEKSTIEEISQFLYER